MTVSHLTRTRDQLWSDLLVALGGDEAFLTRSISERKVLLEILATYGSSVSLLTIDDVDALLAAVVNAAGGTASHLRQNKHEMLAALVTALGGTAPSASTSSTGELLAAAVNAADTGGGSAPEWVPTDAKIYIDLVNDRAWTEADGEVAINTLLGADANTENAWDTSAYNPANLSEFGYTEGGDTQPLGFIGALRTKMLAGCTARFLIDREDSSAHNFTCALVSADGNHAIEVDVQGGQLIAQSWDGPFNEFQAGVANVGTGSKNAIALTTTPSRLEAAINVGDPIAGTLTTDEYPVSGGGAIVAGLISISVGTYLQSITIYDALPSTAGLSALSETGVTA